MISKEIIDNSEGNKLVSFLNAVLRDNPKTNFDVATAFFNVQAFAMVKDNLNGVERFRLLLGKSPEIDNNQTLGDVLRKEIKNEIEGFELTKGSAENVKLFIEFLKRKNVEVRLFEKFLHGKAYIFDSAIVIGSSNFTAAGLTRYGELNSVSPQSMAQYTRKEWFEKFWAESADFKAELIRLLEESRFGSKQYTPFEVYIKTLYEFQKEDILGEEKAKEEGTGESLVYLSEFQDDAIHRILSRLDKYGAVIVADSVGLGKTHIALKIIEKYHLERRKNRTLVICPAQLRDLVWRKQLKNKILPENIISQEDIASEDFLKKAKAAIGGRLEDVELIVVDESHNFRNPQSNRWENLFTLVNDNIAKKGRKPHMVFLTATPINNTIWDLYNQIMLLVLMDNRAFIKENIPDLLKFFKEAHAKGDPSRLNDLLNEISIRRTRDYIIENYPNAFIREEQPNGGFKEWKITFPERVLENVNYELDKTYKGMYREISDVITHQLMMAYYRILEYKKEGVKTEEERLALGRMVGISGIFRTILLKRLESSVDAFRKSISNHIKFLEKLKKYLNEGKLLTKQAFIRYLMSVEDEEEVIINELENFNIKNYDKERLFTDIDADIELLRKILEKVNTIKPDEDAKLKALKKKLLELSKDGQILLFTYYADTLGYIYKEIVESKEFSGLRIAAISSSGLTSKDPNQREKILEKYSNKEIDILLSTDVLSEGQNLQSAKYLLNYDLHWNPTRMIQRAGRIDRIGSPYKKIYVYNFFPEDELEELLKLVQILQDKIIAIDNSIGLDQSILGEEIHPKVFGILRRIREKDSGVFKKLETDAFGGGEKFYQPLKDFLKNRAREELERIPYGIFSGLKNGKVSGVFFYYKYGTDFHFWYLYDINADALISNKTEIVEFITCKEKEARVIPNFFEKVYEINKTITERIEVEYKEIELSQQQDSRTKELSKSKSTKFINTMIKEIELDISEYSGEFPSDKSVVQFWEPVKNKLISIPPTKKRLQALRKMWKKYKSDNNWKQLIKSLNNFILDMGTIKKSVIEPFDPSKLKLVTVDFIS